MQRVRNKPEEIAIKLRQVDVQASQGNNVVDAIREIETRRSTPRSRSVINQMRSRQHRWSTTAPCGFEHATGYAAPIDDRVQGKQTYK